MNVICRVEEPERSKVAGASPRALDSTGSQKGRDDMVRGDLSQHRRLLPFVWVLSMVVFLAGCSSAKFIATGPSYPARADDCHIEVFSSKSPDRPYEELGIIEGEGSLGADTMEEILPKMKREACRAGGDAIVLTSSQKTVDVSEDSSDEHLNVTATVIRWAE